MRNFLNKFSLIFKIKSALGGAYRSRQRNKGSWITSSANQLAKTLIKMQTCNQAILTENKTPFEVLILSKAEDFQFLQVNIQLLNEKNWNIARVNLIVDKGLSDLKNQITGKYKFEVTMKEDRFYTPLFEELKSSLDKFHPNRRTWIRQQLIKTAFVYNSTRPILIIDSDTFIVSNNAFINDTKQILLIGDGFHFPYSRHIKKFLNLEPHPFSFVHHVQLQYPELVKEIYGADLISGLRTWMNTGVARFEFSPISEFQTYGEYLLHKKPGRASLYAHKHLLLDVNSVRNFSELPRALKGMQADLVTLVNKHLRVP